MNNNEEKYNSKVCYNDEFGVKNSQYMDTRASYDFNDSDLQLRERRQSSQTTGFQSIIDEENVTNRTVRTDNIDLIPSPTTMQFVGKERSYLYEDFNNRENHIEDDDNVSYRINTKSKIMIAVYALVVLTIFTLIVLNTRLLKTMDDNINEQEATIQTLTEENIQLHNQFEFVSSNEEVLRRAAEMGMVEG